MATLASEDIGRYPLLHATCLHLQKTSGLYAKIVSTLQAIPANYAWAEAVCGDAFILCGSDWDRYARKLEDLTRLSLEFLRLQVTLEKTGAYPYSSFEEVATEVFNTTEKNGGVDYLWGLYFSEVFWVTHHRLFQFFLQSFCNVGSRSKGACLDVPVGSGIFLSHFLSTNPRWNGVGIDLSQTAVDLSKRLLRVRDQERRTTIARDDFSNYSGMIRFDRIICVEFLEHVEDPVGVLKKLHSLLSDDGKVFITTVTWAAAIDHIYLYKTIAEIKEHVIRAGFVVETELVQNIFSKDHGRSSDEAVARNYSAVLKKSAASSSARRSASWRVT